MSMQTDVKSAAAAAGTTTTIFDGSARIKGIVINYASGGTLDINDGTGGRTAFSFVGPAAIGSVSILVPGEGIKCHVNVSAVCGAGTTAVVFYG
jgi:hypothetical protein